MELLNLIYWMCWVETGATRRKTTQEEADLQSICALPLNSASRLALALALVDSLKLISSHLKLSNKPIVVETKALQCVQHSHLCVFFCQSSQLELLVKFVFSRRQEDTLHQKVDRALIRSSPAHQDLPQPGLLW